MREVRPKYRYLLIYFMLIHYKILVFKTVAFISQALPFARYLLAHQAYRALS